MPTIFQTPQELFNHVGKNIENSPYLQIDQNRIDTFADATGDHQWIHVDPKAAAKGPYGSTIAHGYLTLSLVNYFLPQMMEVKNISMGINAGCNKIRFPNVVRVGARLRGTGEVISVSEKKGAIEAIIRIAIEIKGEQKPACVVDTVSRYFPENSKEASRADSR